MLNCVDTLLEISSWLFINSLIQNVNTKAQHGGAHFNVLIKNPAKAASPTLPSTNERPGSEAEGARARCDWLMLSVAPEFHHQPPD